MCFYCFMPRFMHAGITCTWIFSSSAHKRPAICPLLEVYIIWCTRIVRCPGFRGCPPFRGSKCIESTRIVVGASTVVRYTVDISYWECPLTEVPLQYIQNTMKSTKVQTLGGIWRMVYWNIWIENTLHAYVLGEHTSMKNELQYIDHH